MNEHVKERAEGRDRPSEAEGKSRNPHVLDGGVGEHPLDVLLTQE